MAEGDLPTCRRPHPYSQDPYQDMDDRWGQLSVHITMPPMHGLLVRGTALAGQEVGILDFGVSGHECWSVQDCSREGRAVS